MTPEQRKAVLAKLSPATMARLHAVRRVFPGVKLRNFIPAGTVASPDPRWAKTDSHAAGLEISRDELRRKAKLRAALLAGIPAALSRSKRATKKTPKAEK